MPAYRLTAEFESTSEGVLPAGTLLFPWTMGEYGQREPATMLLATRTDGQGYRLQVPNALLEAVTQPKWTEFEALARFYMTGRDAPPHVQLPADEAESNANLNRLASAYNSAVFTGRLKLPNGDRHGELAVAMMDRTQGGQLTGEAVALRYLPSWGAGDHGPRTVRFKLCDHAKVVGAGANPMRGWHPGRCSKCGLDLSVDSGD